MLDAIPRELLQDSFSYQAMASGGLYGEDYSAPVVITDCYIEITRKLVRGANGDMSTVDGTIFFNGSKGIVKNSVVTLGTKKYTIFNITEPKDPFTGIVHHTEIMLQESF